MFFFANTRSSASHVDSGAVAPSASTSAPSSTFSAIQSPNFGVPATPMRISSMPLPSSWCAACTKLRPSAQSAALSSVTHSVPAER